MALHYQIDCLTEQQCLLGESPIWHQAEQLLYWVDALKPALHALDPKTGTHQYWEMPALIGSIAPRVQGGLIAALGCGIAFIDLPAGTVKMQRIINPPLMAKHLNDGKCDRQGRFWVGEVSHNKNQPIGKLYRFDLDHSLHTMKNHIALFNGPCWSPNDNYFYYTDYFNQRGIFRYAFDTISGKIKTGERFIQIPKNDTGIPDGCTIDNQGYLWSAKWNGHRITRYTPEGNIDIEISLPIQRPTSCIFGGENLNILFVTSASQDVGETMPLQDADAGKLFAIKFTQIQGVAETPFKG